MRFSRILALAPVALALGAVFGARSGTAPSVSVRNATQKIRPTDEPSPNTSAQIFAAKNEFEAFQVIISGGNTGLSGLSAQKPRLVGPGGSVIGGANVRLYREDYQNIATPSNTEGGTGLWPDILIPDVDEVAGQKRNAFPFNVPAGENRVLWCEVLVPAGATAGIYRGTLQITSGGPDSQSFSVPVTLQVWNFSLPSTSSLRTFFGMGVSTLCNAYYGSYDACGQDAGVIRTKTEMGRFLLDHRISSQAVYYGPTKLDAGGYDWAAWDANYGALLDGSDPKSRLQGARLTSIPFVWVEDAEHYNAWAAHAREKGWLGRAFQYTVDEPPNGAPWNTIEPRAALAHGADPKFRTLVTTPIGEAKAQHVAQFINILTPVINYMDDKPGQTYAGNQRATYNTFLSNNPNNQLWMYQSCLSHGCEVVGDAYFSSWPSYMVDASAVQNRAMEWMSFIYKTQGELYFALDYVVGNPNYSKADYDDGWKSVYAFGGNGDGTLIYPGTPAHIGGTTPVPLASLRLKMIREGLEDYEYLKKVSDLGDPTFARRTALALFPNAHSARQSPADLMAARAALAKRILELKG